jgi:hypothetical protein
VGGPACEVLLESDAPEVLLEIDAVLARVAERIERTRKGRVWNIWVDGRPVDVAVESSPPSIVLSAGCNGPEDYRVLARLAASLAERLRGLPSSPTK